MKIRAKQTLAGYNKVQERRARKTLFQSLGHDRLVSCYNTKSVEELESKELLIDVVHCKFLKTNEENGVFENFMLERMQGLFYDISL